MTQTWPRICEIRIHKWRIIVQTHIMCQCKQQSLNTFECMKSFSAWNTGSSWEKNPADVFSDELWASARCRMKKFLFKVSLGTRDLVWQQMWGRCGGQDCQGSQSVSPPPVGPDQTRNQTHSLELQLLVKGFSLRISSSWLSALTERRRVRDFHLYLGLIPEEVSDPVSQ